jgi:hypothetical protein
MIFLCPLETIEARQHQEGAGMKDTSDIAIRHVKMPSGHYVEGKSRTNYLTVRTEAGKAYEVREWANEQIARAERMKTQAEFALCMATIMKE